MATNETIRDFVIESLKGFYDRFPKNELNETSFMDLKNMMNQGTLVPGKLYRITDYVTRTTQTDTQSANHPFDIVLLATSENTLDCHAMAVPNSNDSYFNSSGATCDMSKWQIWYDINNDTSKYAWADATNGKGVIYRMIDEWGNDCPYDFKNIQFKRKINQSGEYDPSSSATEWVYTFDYNDGTTHADISVFQYINDEIESVSDNIIKDCHESLSDTIFTTQHPVAAKKKLNNNVFLCSDLNLNFHGIKANEIGENCYNNTFHTSCCSNKLGTECYNNVFGPKSYSNIMGDYCYNNKILIQSQKNIFGNNCNNIEISSSTGNVFGNDLSSITFGNGCSNNIVENGCSHISAGNYFQNNKIGSGCSYIYFTIPNSATEFAMDYVRNFTIEPGNNHIYIQEETSSSSWLQNALISRGVNNSNTYLTISEEIVPGNEYKTIVSKLSNGSLKIYIDGAYESYNHVYVQKSTSNDTYPLLTSATANLSTSKTETTKFTEKVKINHSTGQLITSGGLNASANVNLISSDTSATPKLVFQRQSPLDSSEDWLLYGGSNGSLYVAMRTTSTANKLRLSSTQAVFSTQVVSNCFITSGGTSLQFIKGDGSLDNTTYLTTQVNADWNASSGAAEILHKPTIPQLYISIHYNDLLLLKQGNGLKPGVFYNIIDYVTKTNEDDSPSHYKSACIRFDLVVLAISQNTLDCHAMAIDSENNFSECDLSKWQIWYDIENNERKYSWIDNKCKGVIYRMIDEYGNDCPYDFKNIQFPRKMTNGMYEPTRGSTDFVYTFSWHDTKGNFFDLSVVFTSLISSYTLQTDSCVCGNKISPFIDNYNASYPDYHKLPNNVFLYSFYYQNGQFDGCFGNKFGINCTGNTLGNTCCNNTFGNGCTDNLLGNNCINNTFGNECSNISFLDDNYENGDYMKNITIEDGNKNIYFRNTSNTTPFLKNILVAKGTNETNSIVALPQIARGLNYRITIARLPNGSIRDYCEDSDDNDELNLYRCVMSSAISASPSGNTSYYSLGLDTGATETWYKFNKTSGTYISITKPTFTTSSKCDVCPDTEDKNGVVFAMAYGLFGMLETASNVTSLNIYTIKAVTTATAVTFTVREYIK